MQALIRTMFRAAAQGDTKAGRQLLEVIARAESGRTGSALEILEHAVKYKEKYGPIFEQREREGLDPPDIFPHPDDMIINETTGEVTIEGPTSKEQAGARKREFKKLKKYHEFLMKDAERIVRHEELRLSRRALETKSHKPNTAKRGPKA